MFPFESEPSLARAYELLRREPGARALIGDFITRLFLYDRITIATVDMVAVPVLILAIGLPRFLAYVEDGVIDFVRYRGALMYLGGGAGLSIMEIRSPSNPPPGVAAEPPSDPAEEQRRRAIDTASMDVDESLRVMLEAFSIADLIPGAVPDDIEHIVCDRVDEAPARSLQQVHHEAYVDVLSNPELRVLFERSGATDLLRLSGAGGLRADQVRWLHAEKWNDEIDVLLHIGQFNLEAALGVRARAADQVYGPSARATIGAKASRAAAVDSASAALSRLETLAGLPDLSSAADDDALMDELLDLRDSRVGNDFRRWFHRHLTNDPDGIAAAFVETLQRPDLADRLGVRALRWVVVAGVAALAGFSGPGGVGAGMVASAADSLIADRFLRSRNPAKVFVREARGITGRFAYLDS